MWSTGWNVQPFSRLSDVKKSGLQKCLFTAEMGQEMANCYLFCCSSDFIAPRQNSISECFLRWYICSLFFILVISWKTALFINRSLCSPGSTTHTKGRGSRASSALMGVINLQGRAYSEKTGCVKLQSTVTNNNYREKQSWVS